MLTPDETGPKKKKYASKCHSTCETFLFIDMCPVSLARPLQTLVLHDFIFPLALFAAQPLNKI